MDLNLQGRRALITGASKGIGRAIAEALAEEGCSLELASRGEEALQELAAELRWQHPDVEIRTHGTDLSRIQDQDALAAACRDVDILVNNAGANPAGSLETIGDVTWREAWSLKVFATINLTRGVYAAMAERRRGVIVIGVDGERLQAQYLIGSTGNAGLMAFTRTLGSVSPHVGVRVVGINPGLTATDRVVTLMRSWNEERLGSAERWGEVQEEMDLSFGRMATPRKVADLVAFLASDCAAYISGTVVIIDGGAANRHD